MNPLLILVIIALVVSGAGLIVFIMLHSGKGTGISDAIASSLYSTNTGTGIIERNLDRICRGLFALAYPSDGSLSAGYYQQLKTSLQSYGLLVDYQLLV